MFLMYLKTGFIWYTELLLISKCKGASAVAQAGLQIWLQTAARLMLCSAKHFSAQNLPAGPGKPVQWLHLQSETQETCLFVRILFVCFTVSFIVFLNYSAASFCFPNDHKLCKLTTGQIIRKSKCSTLIELMA